MVAHTLEGHLGTTVTIDVCVPSQVIWFDTLESLRLAPGAILHLFRIIGDEATRRPPAVHVNPACPRCRALLLETHDRQRNTPFQYLRCPDHHGRLTGFYDFLREKDFIKPISPDDLAHLKATVKVARCQSCGGLINLETDSVCTHCGAAISILDVSHAQALVDALRQNATPRSVDPDLPQKLRDARKDVESSFATFEGHPGWVDNVAQLGVVGASLAAMAHVLRSA